jgi:small-conductance mechanosensitive channel
MNLHSWPAIGIAVAIVLVASYIAYFVLRRFLALRWVSHSAPGVILRHCEPALKLVAPAIGLVIVLGLAPSNLPYMQLAQQLATVLLIIAATLMVARGVQGLGQWMIQRHPANVADNLTARRLQTQVRVVVRIGNVVIVLLGFSIALMTFPAARQFGASLLASAGVAGLVVGLAARSVLSNLLAGLQIAFAQPMRIDDVLIVQGEWGRIEEITSTYVVLKIWDERRLIIPLQWFISNPFQNWTRTSAEIIGSIFLWVDFDTPLEPLRAELKRLADAAPEWDKNVCILQVTDASDKAMQLRIIVSTQDSGSNWNLKCKLREGLIDFLQKNHPDSLPRLRAEVEGLEPPAPADSPAAAGADGGERAR